MRVLAVTQTPQIEYPRQVKYNPSLRPTDIKDADGIRQLEKVEGWININRTATELNKLNEKVTTVLDYLDSQKEIVQLFKSQKNQAYKDSLARELVEVSNATVEKIKEVVRDVEYANLLQPSSADSFKKSLENLITVSSMKNLPESIEQIWDNVIKLRAQMIDIAKSIEEAVSRLHNQLRSLKHNETTVSLTASTRDLIQVHKIKIEEIRT